MIVFLFFLFFTLFDRLDACDFFILCSSMTDPACLPPNGRAVEEF